MDSYRRKTEESKMVNITRYPKIGETITVDHGIELAMHFGLIELAGRLSVDNGRFGNIEKYDGCSCIPDHIFVRWSWSRWLWKHIGGLDWQKIIDLCCLPHDLEYAWGTPGDEDARLEADKRFLKNLVTKAGVKQETAYLFFNAVRCGGVPLHGEPMKSYHWGFARR